LYAIYESGGNADLTSDALLGSLKPSVPARRLFRFFAIYAYRTRIDFIYPDDAATTNQTLNGGQLNEHVTYRLNDDCATTTTSNYSILLLLLFVGEISFANIYIYIYVYTHATTSSLAGRAIISETNDRRSGATQCARGELPFNIIPTYTHWYDLQLHALQPVHNIIPCSDCS